MTDIVIRALSKKEAHDLRMIKLRLEERNWRTLILRIIEEWESTHFNCEEKRYESTESESDKLLNKYDGRD